MIRPFHLVRNEDQSGISGTGIVAWGVVFPDGHTVLRWNTKWHTTGVYDSLEQMLEIHGHGGMTVVQFME